MIETASLFLLLVVIGLRPLIGESYDLAGLAMTSALVGITDPLPLHTLLIDVAILVAALGWAVAKALQPERRYRWSGLEVGLILVVVASVVSCATASAKRVALNASVDWVAMALVAIVLTQLLRDRRQVRLALCVIVASGAAQAYQCFEQVFVGFPETERMYLERREAFWEAQGVPLDSPQVALFEARMQAREASGYLAHSNVAGAHLLVALFAALAVAAGRWPAAGGAAVRPRPADRLPLVAGSALALFLLAAMALTRSIGALSACAAGVGLWAIRSAARRWIETHRMHTLALGWGMVIGGALAVVGHGALHGSLPGHSLNFRWGYWTASADLIADHTWTGVGRENFGDAYLKYKSIASPEEVKNPHSFLVGAAADGGVIGLVGVVAMMLGGSIAVTRRLPDALPRSAAAGPAMPSGGHPQVWMLLLVPVMFGARLKLLGSDVADYLYVVTVLPALVWLLAFAVCAFGPDPWEHAGRSGWLRGSVLINCGLFAFLLQDSINFAIIVPGSATAFFALAGVAIAARRAAPVRTDRVNEVRSAWSRWAFAALIGLALAIVVGFIVPPVWRATRWVGQARTNRGTPIQGSVDGHMTNVCYLAAIEVDPLDPTAAGERAQWLRRAAGSVAGPVSVLREALASIEVAIARRPLHVGYHRRRAMISMALARLTEDPIDRLRALESAERALELYPARPASYTDLANVQAWVGRTEGRAALVKSAVANYRRALDLDSQRPAWEEIRRFRPATVDEIRTSIASAQAWLREHSG